MSAPAVGMDRATRAGETTPAALMVAYQAAYLRANPTRPAPEMESLLNGMFQITSFGVRWAILDAKELEARTARLNAKAKGNR